MANSPKHQLTQQFLSSILSQAGPSALPYSSDAKWLIREHLVSLTKNVPSLDPKTATFTHNDGRTVNLLQADGTIPMNFRGVAYNIPVVIWLMESYPRHPPCVYVNPTRDMIIKRPHPFVNPSGLVSTPFLQNWVYPSSNLADLASNLSILFGRDPPLYSQRRPTPNPNPNPNSNFGIAPGGNSSNLGSTSGYAHPSIPPRNYPPSPYGSGGAASASARIQPPSHTEDPTEVFKRNAINKLVELMLESAASDLAIEDAVYSLDKALQIGSIPFDQYLRSVRSLSREQYFHRALGAKVRAAQLQAQDERVSPRRDSRVVMLKHRFADTVLRAQLKTRECNGKTYSITPQKSSEEFKSLLCEETVRIEAQIKVIEATTKMRTETDLKKQRMKEREAARTALAEIEKPVDIEDKLKSFKELECCVATLYHIIPLTLKMDLKDS
ncbi:protein ELC-like [Quillaja saponaria]|uniref:Protein ELC-like n=1 Tax=Quillaja saponaria TaxID=32244 RepID=A0AAD7LAL5_QUISA|nr:protein ELC-like [Quillaja saponaria]